MADATGTDEGTSGAPFGRRVPRKEDARLLTGRGRFIADVRLPDIDKHTTSFWLTIPADVCHQLGRARAIEGLRGLANALQLVSMCIDEIAVADTHGDTLASSGRRRVCVAV